MRFPTQYRERFVQENSNKRKSSYRAKYELISHYVFHRFNLSKGKGEKYKADYIKSIVEKAKKDNTKVKSGLFKEIP